MKFRGFSSPRTTPTPDEFYDRVLPEIDNLAELKVVLYVIRHTFGWGKFIDRISLSQFVHGVTRRSIIPEGDSLRQADAAVDRGTGLSEISVREGLRRGSSTAIWCATWCAEDVNKRSSRPDRRPNAPTAKSRIGAGSNTTTACPCYPQSYPHSLRD